MSDNRSGFEFIFFGSVWRTPVVRGVGLFYILPDRLEGSSSTVKLSLKTPPSVNICEGRTQSEWSLKCWKGPTLALCLLSTLTLTLSGLCRKIWMFFKYNFVVCFKGDKQLWFCSRKLWIQFCVFGWTFS